MRSTAVGRCRSDTSRQSRPPVGCWASPVPPGGNALGSRIRTNLLGLTSLAALGTPLGSPLPPLCSGVSVVEPSAFDCRLRICDPIALLSPLPSANGLQFSLPPKHGDPVRLCSLEKSKSPPSHSMLDPIADHSLGSMTTILGSDEYSKRCHGTAGEVRARRTRRRRCRTRGSRISLVVGGHSLCPDRMSIGYPGPKRHKSDSRVLDYRRRIPA